MCLQSIVDEPEALTLYSIPQLVEQAGTQGVELLSWIAMRGALTGRVSKVHSNYHIPISNTVAGPAGARQPSQGGVPQGG
jgi:protocatechuate 4,5-dioxygenase beta chain